MDTGGGNKPVAQRVEEDATADWLASRVMGSATSERERRVLGDGYGEGERERGRGSYVHPTLFLSPILSYLTTPATVTCHAHSIFTALPGVAHSAN